MAGFLASEEELEEIKDILAARDWAGLPEAVWDDFGKQLGLAAIPGLPGLRVLASLPAKLIAQQVKAVKISADGGGTRSLTAVEITQVVLIWRVVRQKLQLPDEDPLAPKQPPAAAAAKAKAAPAPAPARAEAVVPASAAGGDGSQADTIRQLEKMLRQVQAENDHLAKELKEAKARPKKKAPEQPVRLAPLAAGFVDKLVLAWQRKGPRPDDAVVRGLSYAHGADSFITLLSTGADYVVEVPNLRWDHSKFYDPSPDRPVGKVYTKHASFLDDMKDFDHRFFRLRKEDADRWDPQVCKSLEAGSQALADAAVPRKVLGELDTAVYVGSMTNDWFTMKESADMAGRDQAANRGLRQTEASVISYMMDFHGPSETVDTACSSSLVAASNGAGQIMSGRCGLALAAGVCYMGAGETFINRCMLRLLSERGRSFVFDGGADGYTRGEAYGALFLARQSKLPEGSCLIAGSSVNQDGTSATLTAPNGPAQSALLRDCHKVSGMMPAEVSCIECAANGSLMGDPIEFSALGRVHGAHPVLLNAVKSSKGHTEGGSGMTGLVKCALMMRARQVAPIIHQRFVNPNITYESYQMAIVDEAVPTEHSEEHALSVGVSAFGFGGTNAHAILRTTA